MAVLWQPHIKQSTTMAKVTRELVSVKRSSEQLKLSKRKVCYHHKLAPKPLIKVLKHAHCLASQTQRQLVVMRHRLTRTPALIVQQLANVSTRVCLPIKSTTLSTSTRNCHFRDRTRAQRRPMLAAKCVVESSTPNITSSSTPPTHALNDTRKRVACTRRQVHRLRPPKPNCHRTSLFRMSQSRTTTIDSTKYNTAMVNALVWRKQQTTTRQKINLLNKSTLSFKTSKSNTLRLIRLANIRQPTCIKSKRDRSTVLAKVTPTLLATLTLTLHRHNALSKAN
mmetsp:Transcript_19834/g.34032  ORF Transcript_19834/g.34032 Transcript_19834/m.34032 type:complete len:281 (+) Transcript_19834:467-1309(+)